MSPKKIDIQEERKTDNPPKEDFYKEYIFPIIMLVVVSLIAAVSLSYVYDITQEKIREQQLGAVKDALASLFGNSDFKKLAYSDDILTEVFRSSDKKYIAYISEGRGYGDKIRILVGIDVTSKTLKGIKIIDHKETPSIGTKILNPDFLGKFDAISIDTINNVDTISGATISSSAVIKAVKDSAWNVIALNEEGKLDG
jgi:Na+-translocating ferredoxin:NAD+ oxidoreductase subunit G